MQAISAPAAVSPADGSRAAVSVPALGPLGGAFRHRTPRRRAPPRQLRCGKPALNAWLAGFARTNQARGFTRVLIVHAEGTVVGYYGLAPGVIQPNSAPRLPHRTPARPDPLPADRTTRRRPLLYRARHRQRPGQGRAASLHRRRRHLGGRAVVVRAIDAEAERYWQSWGLIPAPDNPSVLMHRFAQHVLMEITAARDYGAYEFPKTSFAYSSIFCTEGGILPLAVTWSASFSRRISSFPFCMKGCLNTGIGFATEI